MFLRQEGIDADQRQRPIVLLVLVVHRLFLDLAALVHGVHGAEDAAALADGFELLVDGFLDQVGEVLDGEAALRSEEHTSELQSLMRISYAVFCLKKKK